MTRRANSVSAGPGGEGVRHGGGGTSGPVHAAEHDDEAEGDPQHHVNLLAADHLHAHLHQRGEHQVGRAGAVGIAEHDLALVYRIEQILPAHRYRLAAERVPVAEHVAEDPAVDPGMDGVADLDKVQLAQRWRSW